ncbi:uncharacterized protein LOC113470214 isoform X1 [Diaphorina citri]|uniref:Uncharacterized protein LOC113470214 isoform X1 n=1 Tax=Diaphorina citri TaxID=121845 RepID=A0A3Q0JC36_DIACI|nr:uncharacterized protein LOC113470214 isoform X1 [Diaphorina citri]
METNANKVKKTVVVKGNKKSAGGILRKRKKIPKSNPTSNGKQLLTELRKNLKNPKTKVDSDKDQTAISRREQFGRILTKKTNKISDKKDVILCKNCKTPKPDVLESPYYVQEVKINNGIIGSPPRTEIRQKNAKSYGKNHHLGPPKTNQRNNRLQGCQGALAHENESINRLLQYEGIKKYVEMLDLAQLSSSHLGINNLLLDRLSPQTADMINHALQNDEPWLTQPNRSVGINIFDGNMILESGKLSKQHLNRTEGAVPIIKMASHDHSGNLNTKYNMPSFNSNESISEDPFTLITNNSILLSMARNEQQDQTDSDESGSETSSKQGVLIWEVPDSHEMEENRNEIRENNKTDKKRNHACY